MTNKKTNPYYYYLAYFAAGVVALFIISNFVSQDVYEIDSCTYNKFACTGWDGVCTDEIIEDCCEETDMCNGQAVSNPYECYHFYCDNSAKFCDAQWNVADDDYTCVCAYTSDGGI